DLDARHALHARPERLGTNGITQYAGRGVVQRGDSELAAQAESTLGDLAQVEDQITRGQRIPGIRRGTGGMALAALRARVELEEVARREVEDRPESDLVRLRTRGNRHELLRGALLACRDARGAREHVHGLREGNRGDEAERDDAVHPPLDEVRGRRRFSADTDASQRMPRSPAERRPDLERRIALGDPERLQQESRQSEEEQDPEERPVADHGPAEEADEALEDQELARSCQRVAPLDPRVGEDARGSASQACPRPVEAEGPASAPVLEDEADDAPREDGCRQRDQAVPEDDLPGLEAGERRSRRRQESFSSSSATAKRSATAP